ncbi:MAG: ABC transporter ATP-binding protein/permease [Treponema sp.]|nr:ABC transporter ATP-binding protein/permease [Treponema sp.]
MSDYFEKEEVVKEYDSKVALRIVSYLKPYKPLVIFTLIALAFSTLGELAVPVLQQRLVDRAIMARFIALTTGGGVELSAAAQKTFNTLCGADGTISIGAMIFVPQDERVRISLEVENELVKKQILNQGQWYAFTFNAEDPAGKTAPAKKTVDDHRDIFIAGTNAAAIKSNDLVLLTAKEKEAIRSGDLALIKKMVLLILAILGVVFFFTFVQTWTSVLVAQKVMKDIRLQLFNKTISQSTNMLSRNPVGRIVTRLTGDVETINEFFTSVLIAFLKDFSVMAGAVITLFILSPRLGAVVLATLPPVLVVSAFSRRRARDAFRRQRVASSKVNSYLSERLSGVQVVQLFLGEKRSKKEFGERNNELFRANMLEMYVYAIFRPLVDFLSVFTTAVVICVGAWFVLKLSLSLGVLIAFINLTALFYSPVMDIAEKYTLLQSAMAGGERVFALLDTSEAIPDTGTHTAVNAGAISFKNVTFGYKEGEAVLKDLSFELKSGEMAAIVGYTGAGKTTITNVLTRLWDIQSGSITVDGVPVSEIPLDVLRRTILPVLQEVFLFSGSVRENITLGLDLSDEEIINAAKSVHAHEFIERLPQGYDTVLSEGAANISSGQRQLLSFARVIAHNPALVILDEATSSIDTETERLIQLGIQRVLSGRTSIVIAHRLSTIRHADRILVLQDGRLAEEGSHTELIRANGLYAGLYRLQFES